MVEFRMSEDAPTCSHNGGEDFKNGTPFPLPKQSESRKPEAKQQLSNGMQRIHRFYTQTELAQGRKTRWLELEITGKVKNLSPDLWTLRHLAVLFLNGNQLQRLPKQVAHLSNLTLLDLSHNKLKSLPVELGDMISLVHLYLNYNMLRVLPYELGKLFRLTTLGLHGNPLSPEISRIYHEQNGTQKLLQFLLDHLAINTAPPPERQWIWHSRERPAAAFSVLCYNVLCDKYATASLYSYCPSWALNWEYRKNSIMKEIRHFDADIVTLQEVETEQFNTLFQPELENQGYKGIFSPKSRAKTMGEDEKKYVDGCAVFWKSEKFELEKKQLIEFTQIAISKAEGNEHMLNRVMTRDNIALAAVLKIKESLISYGQPGAEGLVNSPLVVTTAHIHWDPEFCDVKLIQTMMLVQQLQKMIEDVGERFRIEPSKIPMLICGDLNSLPNSGVFEFMGKGKIAKDHVDYKHFREESQGLVLEKLANVKDDSNHYFHDLKLESAYEPSTIPFTNYTLDFKGIIDYIFATPSSMKKLGVLGPLDPAWINQNKIIGFPHPHIPSDHIPLLVQYSINLPQSHQPQQQQLQNQPSHSQHIGLPRSGGSGYFQHHQAPSSSLNHHIPSLSHFQHHLGGWQP